MGLLLDHTVAKKAMGVPMNTGIISFPSITAHYDFVKYKHCGTVELNIPCFLQVKFTCTILSMFQ